MLIFKDLSSNCVDPKMKVKTETQQTFIYFTKSNCFRISSLWMLFLPYPPDPWPSSPLLWSIFLVIITLQNENEMITLIWWLFSPNILMNPPFSTDVPLLYPLKTSENWRFSDVFKGYRSRALAKNGLSRFGKGKQRITFGNILRRHLIKIKITIN